MNRYSRIRLYQERSEGFVNRILSLLERMKLDEGFSEELADFQRQVSEAGVQGEDAYDCLTDFESSLADHYFLLSDGIHSAVLTALYHLWERDTRDLCKRMLQYSPVADGHQDVTDRKIQTYKYDKIRSLLIFWGAQESIFDDVDLLNVLANTIKHGPGSSATGLLKRSSKYYDKLTLFCNLEFNDYDNYSDEAYRLNIDDIKYFGSVLSTFWAEIGKNIDI
jgi:hypothetical protein